MIIHFCFQMYLAGMDGVYVNQFNANLQTVKLDMTRITSSRNVISMEHAASAVFVVLLVLPQTIVFTIFQHKMSLGFILKMLQISASTVLTEITVYYILIR